MEFVLRIGDCDYEVRLSHLDDSVPLAEVLAPWGGSALLVDGNTLAPVADPLRAGLRNGSLVSAEGSALPGRAGSAVVTSDGTMPWHRPPRVEYPLSVPPLVAPGAPPQPTPVGRFGWGTLLVPLVLGLVMAVAFHPRMAAFALFSPAMMVSNWLDDRRHRRRDGRRARHELDGELSAFAIRLQAALATEALLRRRAIPDPDTLIRRLEERDARIWERRSHHGDAMHLGVGTACMPWRPELATGTEPAADVIDMLAAGVLHDVPVGLDLGPGGVVGIAGAEAGVVAVARSLLVQAAVLHGPADLEITIVTDRPARWDWAKWLPHLVADRGLGRRRIAMAAEEVSAVSRSLRCAEPPGPGGGPAELLVVDVSDPAAGRYAAIRRVLDQAGRGRLSVLALAAEVGGLPSSCAVIVVVDAGGGAEIRVPSRGELTGAVTAWRVPAAAARRAGRLMSALSDPDVHADATDLAETVRLLDLLQLPEPSASSIAARWSRYAGHDPAVPIGVSSAGVLVVDLVADGPHGLLAGTTGSGKSELLRSLVAGLAATFSPDEVTFVLVDYKGGSAFDAAAGLPHTVGLVTDLDKHLAQRALTCLEAELQHRERRLREWGATDLAAFRASDATEPLPRLVVVIDEFAALARELPEFVASLVDVAQRGRSLGVHLLLATQRPQGIVNETIRANTNLRIALRVQDAADSTDVIGRADAAAIARGRAGRGLVRRGPGDVVAFQGALVSRPFGRIEPPRLAPFLFAADQPVLEPSAAADSAPPSDLEQLVGAIAQAARHLAVVPPRRPWPEPLATVFDRSDLIPPRPGAALLGLADEPARQRQCPAWWSPADGNLLLYGVSGSGTTTALAAIACGLAEGTSPDDLHLYVLDCDDQTLAPLASLPHVGAVVGSADRERQVRLLATLQREIGRRRSAVASASVAGGDLPGVVLLVDNFAGFSAAFDDPADLGVRGSMARIVADGPGVGIVTVAAAKQPVDVPAQVASLVPAKLLFRLADRYEYAGLGVPVLEPPRVAGRCFESWSGREVQVARPHPDGIAAGAALACARWTESPRRPAPVVGALADEVKVDDVVHAAEVLDVAWRLPIGIGDAWLEPVGFRLGERDHVLVTGPARSGKSTTLAALAAIVTRAAPEVTVIAMTPRRSPLGDSLDVDVFVQDPAALADAVAECSGRMLVLVDDAHLVDDPGEVMARLVDGDRCGVHVVAAGAAEPIRTAYGHWTAVVRRGRLGVALRPSVASDGDIWHTTLPRRGPSHWPPGRGYLVEEGRVELVQAARP
ncbi:MAG TPA: FtsK/SpoIIIE domain-containing protein [Acidimicrobiia bacterium]